jgi:PAS domain S-box-containing protein
MLLSTLGIGSGIIVLALLLEPAPQIPAAILGMLLAVAAIAWLALRLGRPRLAAGIYLAGFLMFILVVMVFIENLGLVIPAAYLVLILMSGLLLGVRAASGMGLLGLLGAAVMYVIEIRGIELSAQVSLGSALRWGSLAGLFVWATIAFYAAAQSIASALGRAQNELLQRKKAEEALQQAHERYYRFFHGIRDAVLVVRPSGEIVDVNPSACEMYGWPRDALLQMNIADLTAPDSPPMIQAPAAGESGPPNILSTMNVRADSEPFPVEVSARQQTIGEENLTLVVVRDITLRAQALQALESLKTFNESIVQNATEGIVVRDLQGYFRFANPAVTRFTSFTVDEVVGRHWTEFIPPDQHERVLAADRQRAGGASVRYELDMIDKGGQRRTLLVSGGPLYEKGRLAGVLAVFTDISDRKEYESQITRHLQRLQALHAIDQAILAAHSPDEIARQALGYIQAIVPHQHASLYTFDYEASEARPMALGQQPEVETQTPRRLPLEAIQPVIDLGPGELSILDDLTTLRSPTSIELELLRAGVRSVAHIPLVAQGMMIGVLKLGADQPGAFSLVQLGSIREVVDSLAIALQQARLLEAERRHRQEAETLSQVTTALTGSLDLSTVLDLILTHLSQVLPYDSGSVMLLSGDRLEFGARQGTYPPVQKHVLLQPEEMPHLAAVLHDHQVVIIPDVRIDPRWKPLKGGEYIRCWMGVPLVAKGRAIGLLNLNKKEPAFYSPQSARLALAFANQAAAAIENARLFAGERQRRNELEVLRKASLQLTSSLELNQVLEAILESVLGLVSADDAHIFLYNGQTLTFGAALWSGKPQNRPFSEPRPEGVTYTVARSGKPLLIPHTLDHPLFPGGSWDGSLAGLPLKIGNQTRGVMNIAYNQPHDFTEDELRILELLADQASIALENARLFTETQRRLQHLDALRTVEQAITASVDLRLTLDILLEQVTTQLKVDAASIMLLSQFTHTLELAARRGFRTTGMLRPLRLRLGESYAGRAALERKLIFIPDLSELTEETRQFLMLTQENFVSYYAVPLIAKGQTMGVLEIFNRTALNPDGEWREFLESLAGQAAIALDNATLLENLVRSNTDLAGAYEATLEGWSRALDLRDKETEGHTQRVTELTEKLARLAGVDDRELIHIRRGALLHDIGKMGIPDGILLKAGPLTEEEWEVMRRHPEYAYQLLSPISFLRPALDIPYSHHERWDGSGYPRGLSGEQIPLAARIFTVVDVYDALLSDRPYRPAWSREQVRTYIMERSGRDFDPHIVELFFYLVGENGASAKWPT